MAAKNASGRQKRRLKKMTDNKIELDEARRAANYEAIKTDVKSEVGGEIVHEANAHVDHRGDIENVAGRMRHNAVHEVIQTENEVQRGRVVARISQVIDYIFFLVYGLLAIRLLLELFAARESAGFFKFIKALTDPIYSPFRGLMSSPSTPEGFTLALPIIVAIVVYMLLHLAINGFLRIIAHRKVEV
jgi:uncharacterized protein YggT (Ycf19 family)